MLKKSLIVKLIHNTCIIFLVLKMFYKVINFFMNSYLIYIKGIFMLRFNNFKGLNYDLYI